MNLREGDYMKKLLQVLIRLILRIKEKLLRFRKSYTLSGNCYQMSLSALVAEQAGGSLSRFVEEAMWYLSQDLKLGTEPVVISARVIRRLRRDGLGGEYLSAR